ncbi:efflux RND transporter permease subunit [Paenibacillus hodogayensis]|uniref:Efflux RND transporter permease subunit n=1 Tax=Paenibacillus hodogayensis TaxID=279208 RepID=A0ABV5VU24_9BACL
MNGFIKFSMKNVAAVIIIIILLFSGGMYSASKLKVENMPNISIPWIIITSSYPAPPKDVMDKVTKPIEDKIANVEGINTLQSTSSDSMAMITIEFKQNTNIDKKKQEIEDLLQDVGLPETATRPKASTVGFSSIPAMYLAAYADEGMSQSELDKIYKDTIEPGFKSIRGVDHVDSVGVREMTMDIQLNVDAMTVYGFTPAQVSGAIRTALSDGAIGAVEFDGNARMARVSGDMNSLYALQNLELVSPKGQTLLLKELSSIQAISEFDFIARLDGQPAIGVNLYKTSGANAVEFSDDARALIAKLAKSEPQVKFTTVYDGADVVRESISGLLREGIIGALLASLMILLFLRNIRMTLIVLVSIPLSVVMTLIMMHYLGITLNIMSLGGMFIAVGRIVDDSIVVIENTYTNLQKAQERNESVILLATRQVAMAITSSTLATVAVFAPIGLLSGMIGEFFRPFAVTVACSLMASLIVALTVIPMLAKLLVLKSGNIKHHDEHKRDRVTSFYEKALNWSLTHRIKTLVISGLLFVITVVATIPMLAIEFFPEDGVNRNMTFNMKLPYGTSLESTDLQAKKIEELLRETKDASGEPTFTYVEALVGYGGDGSDKQIPYRAQFYTAVNERTDPEPVKKRIIDLILADLPQGSEFKFAGMNSGGVSSSTLSYSLKGDDQAALEQGAELVRQKMKEFPELTDLKDTLQDAKTEVKITVDSAKARRFGLSPATIREAAGAWVRKENLGDIKLDNVLYKTTIGISQADKNSLQQIGKMQLQTPDGAFVYLNDVAKIEEVQAPATLSRDSRAQVVTVSATINASNKLLVTTNVTAALASVELPSGVTREVKGVNEDINESFSQLFMAMTVAILIVYLVMVLAFGNASAPFAILFSLPLAVIGGLLGLALTGESLNVTSMIGFMMLIGIVVTNAIVLIDRAQQLRQTGYTVRHALIEAGIVRLRPIIMTAGATIVAMLPLALGFSHGVMISKGLAVVVIGGLTTSTLLTLVVVPVVYELIEAFKARIGRIGRKKRIQAAAPAGAGTDI